MIKLLSKTNTVKTDADYPNGKIKNNPGDNTGNSLNENFFNDYVQLLEKIFTDSGITANGLPDNLANGYQLFTAFQKMSRPYNSYTALILQVGTGAPIAVVLENNLLVAGTAIIWARTSQGVYTGTLAGAFTSNKTWFNDKLAVQSTSGWARTSDNVITVTTKDLAGAVQDDLLVGSIEIRVYR